MKILLFLIKWAVNIIALFMVMNIVSGVHASNWQAMVVAAFIIGLLNAFLRPILILLTLPLTIASLGIFTLIINAFMFYLASKLVIGFTIASFWSAFWAALLFSIISFILSLALTPQINFKLNVSGNGSQQKKKYDNVIDVEGKVED